MDEYKTLPGLFLAIQKQTSQTNFFEKQGQEWIQKPWQLFAQQVSKLAGALKSKDIQPGACVGLIGPSCSDWLAADLAIQFCQGTTVPMFVQLSPEIFEHEIKDANIEHMIIIGQESQQSLQPFLSRFKSVIGLGDAISDQLLQHLDQMDVQGIELSDPGQEDALATIIYTSGSTGLPKGVELSQKNLISQIKASKDRFPLTPKHDKILSCLPLAHIFERMVMYFYVSQCVPIYFVRAMDEVGEDLKSVQPTVMTLVPRLLEKVHAKIFEKVGASKGVAHMLGSWALDLASKTIDITRQHPLGHAIANKLVYKKLRAIFGGRLRIAISGGAALNPALNHFFLNIGVPIYQGYGLTECSPVLCANYPGYNLPGTVGPVFPGVEVRIAEDGEILGRGPNVMQAYHNLPEETANMIDSEGWLHTGDKGEFNEHGFLCITGRIKELFKTSNGKYVSPVPIEQAICKHPLLDMAMVIAEGKKFVSCLVFPDPVALKQFGKDHGLGEDLDNLSQNPELLEELQKHFDNLNQSLNHWEQVQKFKIISDPVSIEAGLLTPTMKIKRHKISEKYKHLIEAMYTS